MPDLVLFARQVPLRVRVDLVIGHARERDQVGLVRQQGKQVPSRRHLESPRSGRGCVRGQMDDLYDADAWWWRGPARGRSQGDRNAAVEVSRVFRGVDTRVYRRRGRLDEILRGMRECVARSLPGGVRVEQ